MDKNFVQNELDQRLMELSDLFEISQTLNSSLNLKSVLDNILLTTMGKMMLSKGFVFLNKEENFFEIVTGKGILRNLIGKKIQLSKIPQNAAFLERSKIDEDFRNFLQTLETEILVPIYSRDATLGILCYGKKLINSYTEQDFEFLESLANIAGSAIQNSLVYEKLRVTNLALDKKIQELNSLFDISGELNSTLEEQKILKLLGYVVMGQTLVNVFVVVHTVENSLEIVYRNSIKEVDLTDFIRKQLSNLKKPVFCSELCQEAQDWFTKNNFVFVVPMVKNDEVHGAILLGKKLDQSEFLEEDLNFLSTLANLSVTALDNARLFAETIEKQKIEEELALARKIQVRLLPKEVPLVEGFDFYGTNIPSKQVGGDYYDFIKIDEDRFLITIADVSGKGTPASLLMASLCSAMRAMIDYASKLTELVEKLNALLFQATDYDKFVTFFGFILNTKTSEIEYVNAGHNPPFLLKANNEILELSIGGPILSIVKTMTYQSAKITLEKGDLLFCYTDGVSEAENKTEDLFGEEKLKEFLLASRNFSAKEIGEKLVDELVCFSESKSFSDDVTMIVIARK
ncbi:SpoIIE family protein phosphatase [bacterium]|nr:SpoIIE family protein phosphatase [bacterium]